MGGEWVGAGDDECVNGERNNVMNRPGKIPDSPGGQEKRARNFKQKKARRRFLLLFFFSVYHPVVGVWFCVFFKSSTCARRLRWPGCPPPSTRRATFSIGRRPANWPARRRPGTTRGSGTARRAPANRR